MNEVNAGIIAGPFSYRHISNLRVSPSGLVPKTTGGIRLATNFSSPINGSVNDFIDTNYTSVQYSSFDRAVVMIKKLGFKAECSKMDVTSAFRLLPMNQGEFDLLGFKIGNWYFIDKCLPMGSSVSCSHFERFLLFCIGLRKWNRVYMKLITILMFFYLLVQIKLVIVQS